MNKSLEKYDENNLIYDKHVMWKTIYHSEYETSAFKFGSEELRRDKDFIKGIIPDRPGIFEYVNDDLKNNRDYILDIIGDNGEIYEYISENLQCDKEITMDAVESFYPVFHSLPDVFYEDHDIVDQALSSYYEFLSQGGKDSKEMYGIHNPLYFNPKTLR